ncbi:hypothetical protein EOM82_06680 [bacterium]|nr:hypothetical protein [bacterium]
MKNKQYVTKTLIAISVVLFVIGIYMAIGFFFDLFIESAPILLIILIILPLILRKTKVHKVTAIIISIILISVSASLLTAVGSIANSKPDRDKVIIAGEQEKLIYSRSFMNSTYSINQKIVAKVWLPNNYTQEKKYPVIYVLDGDVLFHSAAFYASEQSAAGNGDIIVVGIGYGYWNSTFARGGINPNTKNLRGRWRDYTFADDTQLGYMDVPLGGNQKRGNEYTTFITETLVRDIRAKYSIDQSNSTILGHSLGGGLAAYFVTQYDPALGVANPFTNFVIADNGYTEYYNRHFLQWTQQMQAFGNAAYSPINIYRIWGGAVNSEAIDVQLELYANINNLNYSNVNNYIYIPEGATHGDTQTISVYNAINLA